MISEREISALTAVLEFRGRPANLNERIASLERALTGAQGSEVSPRALSGGVSPDLFSGALLVKEMSAQINVIIHVVGILAALPRIMEPGERIVALSLGAGTGGRGRRWDLETDRRVAEFKFIHWQKSGNRVRENGVFVDVFRLAEDAGSRHRALYITGADTAVRFLESHRSIKSVLRRHGDVASELHRRHGERFATVGDYWAASRDRLQVVELTSLVPGIGTLDRSPG
jgi:hypothetical protein